MELVEKFSIFLLFFVLFLTKESDASLKCSNKTRHAKVGCYKFGNYLGNLLVNDRDPSSIKNQGHLINWDKIEESLHSLICRCSQEVKRLKYKYFGIRFYAECWAGNHIPLDGTQKTNTCFQGQNMTTCYDNSTLECAGKNGENYIYKLQPNKIDGGFSNWTNWTKCNASCGNGVQSRERKCDNPAPKYGGAPCKGNSKEYKKCLVKHCPVNGGFSAWSKWTSCSAKCGKFGKQSRTRQCNNPVPKHGGMPCQGHTKQNQTCRGKPCKESGCRVHYQRVCEDRPLLIKCPIGKRISIKSAMYGRKTMRFCPVPRCHARNVRCQSRGSYSLVARRCNKRRVCQIVAHNWVFGEPCHNTSKYLEVKFSCVW